MKCCALVLMLMVAARVAIAAEPDSSRIDPPGYGELGVLKNYEDPEKKESHLAAVGEMNGYFAFKTKLRESTGLSYVIEYAPILQWGAGEFHGGHELNLIGLWNAYDLGDLGEGSLYVWFQHALTWSDLTTTEFMDSLGVISPVNGGDTYPNRSSNHLQLLAWEQQLAGEAARVMLGKITTRVTFNQNRFAVSDREDFFTPMIVNNPVVPFTARGGLAAFGEVRTGVGYISGMVRDADASSAGIDVESLETGNWEYLAELGWTPNWGEREGNYRVTYHYTDAIGEGESAQAAGGSISISADQDIGASHGAFFRYAHAENPLRVFQSRVAGGLQWLGPFGFEDDRIGLGFWHADPVDPSLSNETGFELFWRMQLARVVELSPDLQLILPAEQGESSVVPVVGLRLRLIL